MRRYGSKRVNPARAQAQNDFVAAAFGQRHRAERDANDGELIGLAEQLGCHFVRAPPLEGWMWIPRQGRWLPVEVKVPEREGLKHEYTPQQQRFIRWCADRGAPHCTLRTQQDVFDMAGAST